MQHLVTVVEYVGLVDGAGGQVRAISAEPESLDAAVEGRWVGILEGGWDGGGHRREGHRDATALFAGHRLCEGNSDRLSVAEWGFFGAAAPGRAGRTFSAGDLGRWLTEVAGLEGGLWGGFRPAGGFKACPYPGLVASAPIARLQCVLQLFAAGRNSLSINANSFSRLPTR